VTAKGFTSPDYATLSDFAGRMAILGRRGRHVADLAVLVREASVWAYWRIDSSRRLGRNALRAAFPVTVQFRQVAPGGVDPRGMECIAFCRNR
jgi:hypothetical protein